MISINRRKILKGISAAGVAVAAPISFKAAAQDKKAKYIAVYVDAAVGKPNAYSTGAIVNRTDSNLVLNTQQPINYRDEDGQLTTIHLNSDKPVYTLEPGKRLPIYAKAELTQRPENLNIQNKLIDNAIAIV